MKKIFLAILIPGILVLAGIPAQAQSGWNWNSQAYHGQSGYGGYQDPHQRPYNCNQQIATTFVEPGLCFGRGWDFGGYFSAMFPSDDSGIENGVGGGISLSYFFDENIGVDFNYALHGQGVAEHVFHTNLVYRLPISGCGFCGAWAPYVFGGWGLVANGDFDNIFDIGVGVEIRFESWGCTALFADYSYNFGEEDRDFSQIRAGFKLPF